MDVTITFTVNGTQKTLAVDPQRLLLDVLREDLQLTGTKYGCGVAQCGACSVHLNGNVVRSCALPVGNVSGIMFELPLLDNARAKAGAVVLLVTACTGSCCHRM